MLMRRVGSAPYRCRMAMSSPRAAVCVAVEPFLLRSALYRWLSLDSRFDTVLCPQGEDAGDFARTVRVQAVLTTTHVEVPGADVILVPSPAVQGTPAGASDGLKALADQIALRLANQHDEVRV